MTRTLANLVQSPYHTASDGPRIYMKLIRDQFGNPRQVPIEPTEVTPATQSKAGNKQQAGTKPKANSSSRAKVVSSDSDTPIRKPRGKSARKARGKSARKARGKSAPEPQAKPAPVLVFTPKPRETREASYLTNFPQKFLEVHNAIPAYFYGPLWHKLVAAQKKRNRSEAQGDYSLFEEYLVWAAGYAEEIAKTDCKPVREPWPFPGREPEPWSD